MPSFNDCRCQKCNAKIGWLGELTDPPPCEKCGHVSDYSETEKKLAEARERLLRDEESPCTCCHGASCPMHDAAMPKTRVVNIRKERCDVKITRRPDNTIPDPPKSGCFGNPYPLGTHGREKCIELYEIYFLDRLETDAAFAEAVLSLQGKVLGCFCKPEACHGDVIKRWLDEQV